MNRKKADIFERSYTEEGKIAVITRGGILQKKTSHIAKKKVYVCWFDGSKHFLPTVTDIISFDAGIDCKVIYNKEPISNFDDSYTRTMILSSDCIVLFITKLSLSLMKSAVKKVVDIAKQLELPLIPIIVDRIGHKRVNRIFGNAHCVFRRKKTYRTELKKQLQALVNNDVDAHSSTRNIFRGQVFISYRKPDIEHVKALIDAIHSDSRFIDVALWFDEQLIAGRSFSGDIEAAIDNSNAVILCVSPEALKKSYVSEFEYPYARKRGKPVVPVEIIATDDKKGMNRRFKKLGKVYELIDLEAVKNDLLSFLPKAQPLSAEKCYQLGVAYRDGVGVEENIDISVDLLIKAAENCQPEACSELSKMCRYALGVKYDISESIFYQNKVVEYYEGAEATGYDDSVFSQYILALLELADAHRLANHDDEGLRISHKAYEQCVLRIELSKNRRIRKLKLDSMESIIALSLKQKSGEIDDNLLNQLYIERKADYESEKTDDSIIGYAKSMYYLGQKFNIEERCGLAAEYYDKAISLLSPSGLEETYQTRNLVSEIQFECSKAHLGIGDTGYAEKMCLEAAERYRCSYAETGYPEDRLMMSAAYKMLSMICRINGKRDEAERHLEYAEKFN